MSTTQYGFHEWKRTCPACNAYELNPEGCCPRCGYDGADEYEQRKRQRLAERDEEED